MPDRCLLEHGLNALVDPEQDDLLYVAETIYADRQAFMECLMHETYEWAYGSHQVSCSPGYSRSMTLPEGRVGSGRVGSGQRPDPRGF